MHTICFGWSVRGCQFQAIFLFTSEYIYTKKNGMESNLSFIIITTSIAICHFATLFMNYLRWFGMNVKRLTCWINVFSSSTGNKISVSKLVTCVEAIFGDAPLTTSGPCIGIDAGTGTDDVTCYRDVAGVRMVGLLVVTDSGTIVSLGNGTFGGDGGDFKRRSAHRIRDWETPLLICAWGEATRGWNVASVDCGHLMEQRFGLSSLMDWLVPFMAFLLCCPQWTCKGTACSFPLLVVQIEVDTVADYCSKAKEPGKYPCGWICAEIHRCRIKLNYYGL